MSTIEWHGVSLSSHHVLLMSCSVVASCLFHSAPFLFGSAPLCFAPLTYCATVTSLLHQDYVTRMIQRYTATSLMVSTHSCTFHIVCLSNSPNSLVTTEHAILHRVPKKHVTTFSTITLTISVQL